jgi:hypothetical protein
MNSCPLCGFVPQKKSWMTVEQQMRQHLGYHALSGEVIPEPKQKQS